MTLFFPIIVFVLFAVVSWRLSRSNYNQLAHFLNSGADNSIVTHESELGRLIETAERYFKERKWGPAEKAFLRVLKLDHKNLTAYRRLAMIYSYSRNYSDAQECLELVMQRETTAADLHNYSTILFHAKQTDKAIQAMEQAIELEATVPRYIALSKLYVVQHQPHKQLEALLAAHELDRQDTAIVQAITHWYTVHNQPQQAASWKQQIIERRA